MNDLELFIAHNLFINKGAYAILLGSGISRVAGIPTGWEILMELINRLTILKEETNIEDYEKWYKEQYNIEPDYSEVIELLTNTREERINLLKPFFENTNAEDSAIKRPTSAHHAIADLVKNGYIKVIITTNFDRLTENALREIGIEATVISNPSHIENVMPIIHSPVTIIKVNGDYLDTKFLNIKSELSAYDEKMKELLKYVFENFGLITSGWSAKWDTGLRNVLKSSNKFRFTNYFTYVNNFEEELKEVSDFRHGKLIRIKDANSFFKELLANIEALQKGERNNPISKPIAIERLKKYILKPESKIDLYELIEGEVQKDFSVIFGRELSKPEPAIIKDIIEFEIKKLDLLYSLLIEGIYWGNETHHEIWLKVISRFAHPKKQNSSWAIWSDLTFFPALVLFYTIGLTSVIEE